MDSTGAVAPAEALYRQGDAAHDAGQLKLAEELLRAALALAPQHWRAGYTLAVVLQDGGRHDEALPLYEALLVVDSGHAKCWNNYGVALHYRKRQEDAIAAYRRAVAIDPNHYGAVANLSSLLVESGRVAEARALLARYCNAAAPSFFDLRRAIMLSPIPASAAAIEFERENMLAELRQLVARPPRLADPLREIGRMPCYQIYHRAANRDLLATLAEVYRRACPELLVTAPHCAAAEENMRRPGHRRRVGFASFYFCEHSVGKVMRGLLEQLAGQEFEIVVVFLGGQANDPIAQAIAAAADRVVETPYALWQARDMLAAQQLDILCLPDFGMDTLSYLLGFARLAPVQITTWGHAETSGLSSIDWFVSADRWERPGAAADYTESLHRLPAVASPSYYRRPLPTPGGISRIDAASGQPSYLCAQSLYKIHPDMDAMFRSILSALPAARLYLVRSGQVIWDEAFATRLQHALGDVGSRVVWLDRMSRADYDATVCAADVLLDTIHFNGGITSLDALSFAKPLVTLDGETMRGRFTAGFYRAMGLADLIADSPEAYLALAIRLGQDAEFRAATARRIEARSEVLFEDAAVVAGWTQFLRSVPAGRPDI